MKKSEPRLALVCTRGGHFEQMSNLSDFYTRYKHFWITNRNEQTEAELAGEVKYFIGLGHFKRPWTYGRQLPGVLRAFARERPTHVVSTGSGMTALVPFLVALCRQVRFIHIDTFSRVYGYSKFGAFLLKIGHPILSQWEDHGRKSVVYIGPVFKPCAPAPRPAGAGHVFVTLGTRDEPFPRLIRAVEELVHKGVIPHRVLVQAGSTRYRSDRLEIFDFCRPERIDALIRDARVVITQESAGIGTKCLKYRTPFVVMPREYRFGELPAKSDMKEDLHLKLQELGYTRVVHDAGELEKALLALDRLKTGFAFENRLAVETLTRIVEDST